MKEEDLLKMMEGLAKSPWHLHKQDLKEGSYTFHREASDNFPLCGAHVGRTDPGRWWLCNLNPVEVGDSISFEEFNSLVKEFDQLIAAPAAKAIGGYTSLHADTCHLSDHFSNEATKLFKRFSQAANWSDGGAHPSDQEKWIDFLLRAYDDGTDVHCDQFGNCVRKEQLWPDKHIPKLVSEYDFAMRLLKQAGRSQRRPG